MKTVGELKKALEVFKDETPIEVLWPHGAEPGPITDIYPSRHHKKARVTLYVGGE